MIYNTYIHIYIYIEQYIVLSHIYTHRTTIIPAHSQEELVTSEEERRQTRLQNARANDVWEYRSTPPESWAAPLPPHLERMRLPRVKDGETSGGCTIL